MAKIGTVQVEVKPAPNYEAWRAVCQNLEDMVAEAVARGVARGFDDATKAQVYVHVSGGNDA